MADTLSELSRKLPSDPDAQAAVTDFLDYTEFFPSDLFRSLTLIGQLDETYQNDTLKVHELAKTYGLLPKLPPAERPDPQSLRTELSTALAHAIRCRESTYAEATRLCNLADGLYNRLVSIKKKLETLPKPPSRDPTPVPQVRSPVTSRMRKPENERAPRITLFTDGNRAGSRPHTANKPRHRVRRIIVPGEVLPPYDPNSPGASDSESDSERTPTPALPPVRLPEKIASEKILKLPKVTTIRIPKIASRARPHGMMGTNVHSQVAGISVSNAMAILKPPPPNPKLGSKHAPWLKLTEWELNKLRKRMKKNADWVPSDTMVRRELAENGRGLENYTKVKAHAEATGEEFVDEEPEAFIRPVTYRSQPGILIASDVTVDQIENRGMKLNQAKKLKRESMLKEQAAQEQAGRGQVTQSGSEDINSESDDSESEQTETIDAAEETAVGSIIVKSRDANLIASSGNALSVEKSKEVVRSHKKRKRDPTPEALEAMIDPALLVPSEHDTKHAQKKLKLGPPVINFQDSTVKPTTEVTSDDAVMESTEEASESTSESAHSAISVLPGIQEQESETEKLIPSADPPEHPTAKERPALELKPPKASTRASRASTKAATTPVPESAPAVEPSAARPRSRGGGVISLTLANKKAASAEPPSRRASGRRASNASLPSTQASNPSKVAPGSTATTRRGKRPAPGLLASSDTNEGGVQVILGKRKAAPGRKRPLSVITSANANKKVQRGSSSTAAPTPTSGAPEDPEYEEEPIDPDEPRYCLCGGVSWGTMVACENDSCEKEWFHLGCVGLSEIPGRRTKWFCPECRVKLKVGEYGEPIGKLAGSATGVRK